MKVGFITYEFPPFVYGGAGVYAKNIVEGLARRGHEVHVLTFAEGRNTDHNIFIHHFGNTGLPRLLWIPSYWWGLFRSFKKEIKGLDLDVMIGNGFSEIPVTKGMANIPRILVMHQSAKRVLKLVRPTAIERISNINNEMGLAQLFDPIMVKRADLIVAVSEFVKRSLVEDLGLKEEKIRVMLNGFDDLYIAMNEDEKKSIRKDYDLNGKMAVLFVGRINDKRKGLRDLLRAFSMLRTDNVNLLVVGGGEQRGIKTLIEELGIYDSVNLLGKVSDAELRRLYCICDLYVSSSFYESFGLTLVEAMSCKKPVIARDVGGIGEVVSDENGILLSDDSPRALAKAIDKVFSDYDTYERIGERNRNYVLNKFSWTRAVQSLEEAVMELVENSKGR